MIKHTLATNMTHHTVSFPKFLMVCAAIQGVINQGQASFSQHDNICVYRGDNNTKCVVGQMIPDDKYTRDIEGVVVNDITGSNNLRGILLGVGWNFPEDTDMLVDLQICHDSSAKESTCKVRTKAEFLDMFRKSTAQLLNTISVKSGARSTVYELPIDKFLQIVNAISMVYQHGASMNGGACAYRADNGNCCLVGHLIPDEFYSRDIEGTSIAGTDSRGIMADIMRNSGWPLNEYRKLLSELQHCHDNAVGSCEDFQVVFARKSAHFLNSIKVI